MEEVPSVNDGWTGNEPGLLQDDSRELSKALSETPDARRHAREAALEIAQRTAEQLTHEQAETIARYLRWNSVFYSPAGLQSLFPGLGPVKGKVS